MLFVVLACLQLFCEGSHTRECQSLQVFARELIVVDQVEPWPRVEKQVMQQEDLVRQLNFPLPIGMRYRCMHTRHEQRLRGG